MYLQYFFFLLNIPYECNITLVNMVKIRILEQLLAELQTVSQMVSFQLTENHIHWHKITGPTAFMEVCKDTIKSFGIFLQATMIR